LDFREIGLSKLAQVVTIPTFIQEVAGFNLDQGTDCPEVFHGFTQSLKLNYEIAP
jgi:hypothetical protein